MSEARRPSRRKVFVPGSRPDVRVPFTEVDLAPSDTRDGPRPNPPVLLYDTSGPGSDPVDGRPS